jgi:hypothetical protein
MKPQALYQELKNLAEKHDITVKEQNLKVSGFPVQSGLCRIKDRLFFIMDKNEPLQRKNLLLADCLCAFSHEHLYVVPAVRDFILSRPKPGQAAGGGADAFGRPGPTVKPI